MMDSPRSSRAPRYSPEQMEAILQRAIQKQQQASQGISHDELLAAAEEVGIPREDIEAAVDDLEAEAKPKAPDPLAIEAAREAALERSYRVHRLIRAAVAWFVVSGILFTVGRNSGHHGLFVFSIVWGILLMVRTAEVMLPKPARKNRESKRARRERERREREQQSLQVFERKLAIGTEAIGHLIDRARGNASPAQGFRPPVTAAPRATASTRGPAREAPPPAVAPPPQSPPSPSAPQEAPRSKSRIDEGAFERFVASRSRVGASPAEELDELEDEADENPAARAQRR